MKRLSMPSQPGQPVEAVEFDVAFCDVYCGTAVVDWRVDAVKRREAKERSRYCIAVPLTQGASSSE